MNKTFALSKPFQDSYKVIPNVSRKALRQLRLREHFDSFGLSFPSYWKRFAYYHQDIIEQLNFFIHDEDSVLEIGCGTGETLARLKGKEKVGIDFSPAMIEVAESRHPYLSFFRMDAEEISLTQKFDVIVLSNVIGFFENVMDVFEEMQKCCHEHTRIYVNCHNAVWEMPLRLAEKVGLKKKNPRQSWLSKADIENLFALTGYEAYHTNRRMLVPFCIPYISWFLNKYIARLPVVNHLCINQFVFARPVAKAQTDISKRYSVSVVVPARNESGNIEAIIRRMPKMGKFTEIIFVEGGSTDDTWEKIKSVAARFHPDFDIKIARQDGKGKGNAVRNGYALATGDILMILDADLTVPPEDLPKFYHALATGKGDFINGCRLIYPMEKQAMRFLNMLGNKFFSLLFSWMLEQPIKDTLCGTKVLFRKDYYRLAQNRKYFGEFDPFGDFDLLFGAFKLNLKIIDLPIRYHERTYGDTNISRFRHGMILLQMCAYAACKIKFR